MKRIMAAMMACMIFSSVAMADCKEIYKKQKISVGAKSVLSTVGGTAISGGGVFVFYVGVVAAILATNNGFLVAGSLAGGASSAGGIYVSVKGVKNGVDFLKKARAYKLIKQSYVGAGKYLNKVAEDLSEDLDKDVTAEDVAAIVVEADQANQYCESKESLYTIDDVVSDIANKI